jgi:NAD(P)-dependent dehydrogenase (short-subunit alcohol dehydrogenase family)
MTDSKLFAIAGKTALVTGGSRGVGFMIAKAYAAHGAKVYISSRKAQACEEAVAAIAPFGECIALPADLAQMSEVERLAAELAARETKLDILVNNAGATWGASIDEFPEAGWDKVMDLNVKSIFFLTQKLLPLLERSATAEDPARVINIGSVDGMHVPIFENFSYTASKAALHQLSRMLAHRLAPRKITVNTIAPGPFPSQMMAPMIDRMGEELLANVPLKRFGTPDDVAGLAIFLAARASAYMTGALIPLDGGITGGM